VRFRTISSKLCVILAIVCAAVVFAGCGVPGAKRVAGLPLIRLEDPMAPPAWAQKQRLLFEENLLALRVFADKYYDERGYLKVDPTLGGGAGADDSTEPTHNWALLYVLGADEEVLAILRKAWEGHFKQYTEVGGLSQEFIKSFDWQHNGEQYCSFYGLGMCDPYDAKYRERIRRFADFYLGMPNYDPKLKIIRSVMNGSEGPNLDPTMQDWGGHEFFRYWVGKKVSGDTPLNLQATSLLATAFMITGEPKYRDWIIEYVDAWVARANANGGNFPTNISLSGKVGEDWPEPAKQFPEYVPEGSKIYPWAAGIMGWAGWGGPSMVMSGVRMGLKNAFLMTGDGKYLEVGKRQVESMRKGLKIGETADGKPVIADAKGHDSQKQWLAEDLFLLDPARHEDYFRKHWGAGQGRSYGYYDMGYTLNWVRYLDGENAKFPEKIQKDASARIARRVKKIGEDKSEDWKRECNLTRHNPVATAALTMLTTGGRAPSWRGSPLMAWLRHFDPARDRPGLPPDVAVLVHRIGRDSVTATFVNLSKKRRTIVVQGGAYAEHQVACVVTADGTEHEVGGTAFAVLLAPGAGGDLTVRLKRFVNQPTMTYPWRRDQ